MLWTCLECYLRLLHPFMPFVTEELYHPFLGAGLVLSLLSLLLGETLLRRLP